MFPIAFPIRNSYESIHCGLEYTVKLKILDRNIHKFHQKKIHHASYKVKYFFSVRFFGTENKRNYIKCTYLFIHSDLEKKFSRFEDVQQNENGKFHSQKHKKQKLSAYICLFFFFRRWNIFAKNVSSSWRYTTGKVKNFKLYT